MKNLIEPIKNKTEISKIESNPSNDRTRHDGDNPSFLDESFLESSIYIRQGSFFYRGSFLFMLNMQKNDPRVIFLGGHYST